MTIRPVLSLAELHLGRPCLALNEIDEVALELAQDLIDTMRSSPACVGLAAPQIGIDLRAFALDCSSHPKTTTCHGELVIFNPVLALTGGALVAREGCMSVPDLTGDVRRSETVEISGTGVDGSSMHFVSSGFEARAIQHECDHLDGLLFLDRLSGPEALHQRRVYR